MTITLKKTLSIAALSALTIGLVACGSKPVNLPGPADTQSVVTHTTIARWQKELKPYHVRLIKQGWRVKWVIPADGFFYKGGNDLKMSAYPVLEKIAKMVDRYAQSTTRAYPVKVYGHVDTVLTVSERQRLSADYAQSVAGFLWNKGFTHRQLMIVGKGTKHPIAPQNTVLGRHYNRRVVIQIH